MLAQWTLEGSVLIELQAAVRWGLGIQDVQQFEIEGKECGDQRIHERIELAGHESTSRNLNSNKGHVVESDEMSSTVARILRQIANKSASSQKSKSTTCSGQVAAKAADHTAQPPDT